MRVTITYCRYYMQRELRREKRFRYRAVTVTANAVMIRLDHVLVSRSNGYGLRTNCSGQDSSKRRIATTQNFCPTIAVSAVTITVSVVTIQVYFSPCRLRKKSPWSRKSSKTMTWSTWTTNNMVWWRSKWRGEHAVVHVDYEIYVDYIWPWWTSGKMT